MNTTSTHIIHSSGHHSVMQWPGKFKFNFHKIKEYIQDLVFSFLSQTIRPLKSPFKAI